MAFEELDYDQCTEENCIRFIQDTLQVESFFSLQLVQEGKVIQLTFMMLDLDREDKQALLEAPSLSTRRETLLTLIEYTLRGGQEGEMMN